MKKFISTAASVLLVMSLISGCTGGTTDTKTPAETKTETETTDSTATTDTTATSPDILLPSGAARLKFEPIADTTPCTITIGLNDSTTNGFENSSIGKAIKELTGITVSLVNIDSTKLTTLAASGDLPDVLYIGDSTGQLTKSLVDSGNLLPLDDMLATRGQNITARAGKAIENLKKQTNGITYVLPTGLTSLNMDDPNYNGGNGFYTRYDLYSEIGAPEITGIDSYLETLKLIQDAYPTAPNGNKAYALSAWTDWGLWPYFNILPGLLGSDGLVANQRVSRYTGEWTSSFLDPRSEFWQSVEFYFKANQLGIFDPDALTQGWDQLATKIANGEVYTLCAGNWSVPDKAVCGDEAGLFLLPGSFPVVASVYTVENELGWGFMNSRAITAACKNPERAMDLFNFFDSDAGSRLIHNGVQGVDWDYVDDVPQPIGDYLSCLLATGASTYIADNGMGYLEHIASSISFTCSDGFLNNLKSTTGYYNLVMEQDKAAQRFVAENNNGDASITYPGKVYASLGEKNIMQNSTHFSWPSFSGYLTASPELAKAEANAETYITGKLGDLILAKDQAAFNAEQSKIIEALKAQGLDKAEEEIAVNWAAARDELKSQVVENIAPLDSGFDLSVMNSK